MCRHGSILDPRATWFKDELVAGREAGLRGLTGGRQTKSTSWMEPRPDPEKPFDERAALAELERVREQIQTYRAQRRDIQDEFGRFTRAFKNAEAAAPPVAAAPESVAPPEKQLPPPLPPIPPPAPPLHAEVSSAATETPVTVLHPPAPAVEPFLPSREPVYVEGPATPAFDVDPPAATPQRTAPRAPAVASAVVAVALLALFAAWMFSGPADQPAAETTSPPPAAATVEPAAAATPPPAEAAPATRGSELTTIRLVWMRVLVDGQRVVEREVPANTKIPLAAKESIVIRAGDGGAVKLTLAGEDQGFLGPEGRPVTRTFTVPPAGAPR